MSYWYPSEQEARDQYYYSRRQYYQAAEESLRLQRQYDDTVRERQYLSTARTDLKNNRINFEKRLAGIDKIIEKLEGRFFGRDVPSKINDASRVMNSFEDSYKRSIRVSGVAPADVRGAFDVPSVEGSSKSGRALEEYKRKRRDLDERIRNIKKSIDDMGTQIDILSRQMRSIESAQWSSQRQMRNSLYNMQHYRNYM